jgi:class 3 adenylate cyclase
VSSENDERQATEVEAPGRLQTFVFADLAGYTAMAEAMGDEAAADVAAQFCADVRTLLGDYGAEEVKAIGDAVMLRVADPGEALHLAARIVCEFATRHRSLRVRVGMHTGTAVQRDGDWFGSAVNLASRVADVARAGEVVMTAATRAAAAEALAASRVRSRGRKRFKNVADAVELFALELDESVRRLPIDPVCHMAVDPDQATERTVYDGVEYHFCSSTCARAFGENPRHYVRQPSQRAELLVSDGARERATEQLARAYRKGRIGARELEERVEQVLSARTRADLQAALLNLPRPWRRRRWPIALLRWLTRPIRRVGRRRRSR